MIAYTIEAAKQSRYIDHVIVSTDDSNIAEIRFSGTFWKLAFNCFVSLGKQYPSYPKKWIIIMSSNSRI